MVDAQLRPACDCWPVQTPPKVAADAGQTPGTDRSTHRLDLGEFVWSSPSGAADCSSAALVQWRRTALSLWSLCTRSCRGSAHDCREPCEDHAGPFPSLILKACSSGDCADGQRMGLVQDGARVTGTARGRCKAISVRLRKGEAQTTAVSEFGDASEPQFLTDRRASVVLGIHGAADSYDCVARLVGHEQPVTALAVESVGLRRPSDRAS